MPVSDREQDVDFFRIDVIVKRPKSKGSAIDPESFTLPDLVDAGTDGGSEAIT